jgi:hypothetical protein
LIATIKKARPELLKEVAVKADPISEEIPGNKLKSGMS